MEKRKIILTVIGVAVLLVLSIFVFNKKNTSPTVVQQPIVNEPTPVVFKNIVTYKNRLFTPSNFSVKSGVTVSFVNESDEDMWVAANPHPSHTSLPSFDAKRGVKPGQTYKYTFVKKGSFGYHNHVNPMARGTLSVN